MNPKVEIGLAPGFQLGDYSILSRISSGWEAEVYTAADTRLERAGNVRAVKFYLLAADEVVSAPVWMSSDLNTQPRGRLLKQSKAESIAWYRDSDNKSLWKKWVKGAEANQRFARKDLCGRGVRIPELIDYGIVLLPYQSRMIPFGFEVMSYHPKPPLPQFLTSEQDSSALVVIAERLALGLLDFIRNSYRAGLLVFNDIHAGNILVEDEDLVLVDLEPPKQATPELLTHQVECAMVLVHQVMLWDLIGLNVQAHYEGSVIADWLEDVWRLAEMAADAGRRIDSGLKRQLINMVRLTHPDAWPQGLWM